MTLFLIPARAGSKRLPGKNKRLFCGLPLWRWSVATACRIARTEDHIIVSSDDFEIQDSTYGMQRSADLCRDDTPTMAVIDDVWSKFPAHSALVLLQPTSPTRPDSLVRMMLAYGGQVRSVTNGEPNGQCWVYRRDATGWADIETPRFHDIDTLDDFNEAQQYMLEKFQ